MQHVEEQFGWLQTLAHEPDGGLLLRRGEGFVTMTGGPGAYASVSDLRHQCVPGILRSATALAWVETPEGEKRFVLLKRDEFAKIAPNRWQFPAGRCSPSELFSQTAERELAEEVAVFHGSQGARLGFQRAPTLESALKRVTFLDTDGNHLGEEHHALVYLENTLEAVVPLVAKVASLSVHGVDLEPYGREVALLPAQAVDVLLKAGELTPAAAAAWDLAKTFVGT